MDTRFKVVPNTRWRSPWVLSLGALLIAALGASLGYAVGSRGMLDLEAARDAAHSQVETLTAERDELLDRAIDLELGSNIEGMTQESMKQSLQEMHDQVAGLREEVTFYRSLMAPDEPGARLADLRRLSCSGWRARVGVPLSSCCSHRWRRSGPCFGGDRVSVTIDLAGMMARKVVLPLTEIEPQTDTYPLKYRFRYFQDFSGTLELPEPTSEPAAGGDHGHPAGQSVTAEANRADERMIGTVEVALDA